MNCATTNQRRVKLRTKEAREVRDYERKVRGIKKKRVRDYEHSRMVL